jgi:hypothetical protein
MPVPSYRHGAKFMAAADEYRRHAIECFRIADETISAPSRRLLMHMAEAWLRLAHQAEKNSTTDLVYEMPLPSSERPVLQQQQAQLKLDEAE